MESNLIGTGSKKGNMSGTIKYTQVSGIDIKRIIDKIEPVINNEEHSHVMMACLVITIGMLKPDITLDQLIEGVKGASEWISLFVAELPGEETSIN